MTSKDLRLAISLLQCIELQNKEDENRIGRVLFFLNKELTKRLQEEQIRDIMSKYNINRQQARRALNIKENR